MTEQTEMIDFWDLYKYVKRYNLYKEIRSYVQELAKKYINENYKVRISMMYDEVLKDKSHVFHEDQYLLIIDVYAELDEWSRPVLEGHVYAGIIINYHKFRKAKVYFIPFSDIRKQINDIFKAWIRISSEDEYFRYEWLNPQFVKKILEKQKKEPKVND